MSPSLTHRTCKYDSSLHIISMYISVSESAHPSDRTDSIYEHRKLGYYLPVSAGDVHSDIKPAVSSCDNHWILMETGRSLIMQRGLCSYPGPPELQRHRN